MEEEKKNNGHGGKREGAGRKVGMKIGTYRNHKSPEERAKRKKSINITLSDSEFLRVKEKANKEEMTVTRFLLYYANCLDEQN